MSSLQAKADHIKELKRQVKESAKTKRVGSIIIDQMAPHSKEQREAMMEALSQLGWEEV